MLADSAITHDVIRARGYCTVESKAELRRLGFSASQALTPTLLIPIWNVAGEVGLYHHRPDTPRVGRDGKTAKYEFPARSRMAVDVHPSLHDKVRDPKTPLFLTEGVKKADAAVSLGLCCLALVGVWNWRGTNEFGGKTSLPDWEGIALKGRRVYVAFDSDVMLKKQVHQALARLAAFLEQRGAKVAFLYLPSGPRGVKVGLDDYLAAGHDVDDLLRLATTTLREPPPGENEPPSEEEYARGAEGLPCIETARRHLRDVSQDALAALIQANEPPNVFVRGGRLVRIQEDEDKRPTISDLTPVTLKGRLARCANFVFTSRQNGTSAVSPPPEAVEDLRGLGRWPHVPPLIGLVTSPVVSEDATLITTPGYHPAARLVYHCPSTFALPDTAPTPQAVAASRQAIDDLLADFPFADESSRAHAWALLLLPFVRPLISGPTPLHLIDAPQAGTGKTLLALVCTNVFLPTGAAITTCPTTEEEWSKTLTSIFLSGPSHVLLDNARSLSSGKLFAALTSDLWADRLMGGNDIPPLPIRQVWAATCNNVSGNDELARRAVWIRLDAGLERPDARTSFRHANLLGYVRDSRASLVGAILTLIRSWLERGHPTYSGVRPPVGSYECWTEVMGGLLEGIGVPGFLENRDTLRAKVDKEATAWHGFTEAWHEEHGEKQVGTGDLLKLAGEWFPEKLGDGGDRSQRSKLGRLLIANVDRVYGGRKLTNGGQITSGPSKGATAYRLIDLRSAGNLGNLGNFSPPDSTGIGKRVGLPGALQQADSFSASEQFAPSEVPQVPQVPLTDEDDEEWGALTADGPEGEGL